ncbi:Mannose-1-phosphate guanylyltransferase [Roseimaritima multifibrata]|uniref:mannose-1-phosphate guanylyltransferase n=1 Tax=Roseimaritima multifibrata TaxID=1930274 RepID=A0A517MBR1_9BACT|nr:mannose-1-phosphate guanylyltransferase [Roseimaritima multifibrata]QDS92217.1 Mannose-1-phosphate guanylyltransferase [Roseimaritima multifibrata]
MLHAVIMAGGSGTRFWPASRRDTPKQLLKLSGDRTMIQATADRLGDLVPDQRKMVVTNAALVAAVRQQLPDLPVESIVGEPCKRDTAPCIGLAATLIAAKDPDATMLVMPADHVITSDADFQKAVLAGEALLDEDPTRIVTFGIEPSYPAESFGYIERGETLGKADSAAYRVTRFREKPDAATAQQYLAAGTFYWNSGIFMWRCSTILEALQKQMPEMMEKLENIGQAAGESNFSEVLEREFAAIEGKSIDYAVMEDYPNIVVLEAPFRWDDVGSWQSLARMNPPDADGNTVLANHLGIDTRQTIVFGDTDHLIVTIDIEDLIVVHTPGATLVAPKSSEERVREVVKRLTEEGRESRL